MSSIWSPRPKDVIIKSSFVCDPGLSCLLVFTVKLKKIIAINFEFGSRLKDFLPCSCMNLTKELFKTMPIIFIWLKIINVLIYSRKIHKKESVIRGSRIVAIFPTGPDPKMVHDWREATCESQFVFAGFWIRWMSPNNYTITVLTSFFLCVYILSKLLVNRLLLCYQLPNQHFYSSYFLLWLCRSIQLSKCFMTSTKWNAHTEARDDTK